MNAKYYKTQIRYTLSIAYDKLYIKYYKVCRFFYKILINHYRRKAKIIAEKGTIKQRIKRAWKNFNKALDELTEIWISRQRCLPIEDDW